MGVDGTSRAGCVFSVALKLVAVGGQRLLNTAYEHCNLHDGCPQMLMSHMFSTVNRLFPVEAREHTVPLNWHTPCQHRDRHLLLGSAASIPYLSTVTSTAGGARWTVLLSVHSQGRPRLYNSASVSTTMPGLKFLIHWILWGAMRRI